MGKGFQIMILCAAFLLLAPEFSAAQGQPMAFRQADSLTLALYDSGDWKGLISAGQEAIRQGHDYYYLRMRLGIAYFERRNYLQAAEQFSRALEFSSTDPVAGEYLLLCLLETNHTAQAAEVFQSLSPSARERLNHLKPRLHSAFIDAGCLFSDQPIAFDDIDLDGEENYYGETDLTMGGLDINAGLSWTWMSGVSLTGAYTFIPLRKNKLVEVGDTLNIDDQYTLKQHQAYLGGYIPLGKNYAVTAAVNVVLDNFTVVMPEYVAEASRYDFPVEENHLAAFIGYLSLTRDFRAVKTSLFGAYSNLNEKDQYQGGFHLLAFPFGNLDFYLSSKLIYHRNDADGRFIFEQVLGARLFGPLWAEANATFGEMMNYHENNAFVVYNFAEELTFKGGAKLNWVAGRRCSLSAEYLYLRRNGSYFNYVDKGSGEEPDIVRVSYSEPFNNHLILLGITWKF